ITTVYPIANELIENGYVTGRPQLGVKVVEVNDSNYNYIFSADYFPELKQYATRTWGMRTQVVPGVYILDASLVVGYEEGSDSLKLGDQLLYVGEVPVSEMSDVKGALNNYNAGDVISITVLREQRETVVIKVILGQANAN
ncbi:MAG: PDZ domain-containing protein, partial [Clostridia bacterium]|nr:PDZ domain-containing protein [Clostridia bacterium]